MTEFTPFASLIGGALIGLSAIILMASNGRIAGISGITSCLLSGNLGGAAERPGLFFIGGLLVAPLLYTMVAGTPTQTVSTSLPLMAVAGVLVGYGSVFGNGCTSGHGVCGISRLSGRSMVATATFMAVAAITVFVTRHVF